MYPQLSQCCQGVFHPNSLKQVNIIECLLLVHFFLLVDFE